MEQQSWRRNHWKRNHGAAILEEESWKRNHGEGIMEEESWRNHGRGIMKEASGRHLEASGSHLAAIWRHLGASEETSGGVWRHQGGIWSGTQEAGGTRAGLAWLADLAQQSGTSAAGAPRWPPDHNFGTSWELGKTARTPPV